MNGWSVVGYEQLNNDLLVGEYVIVVEEVGKSVNGGWCKLGPSFPQASQVLAAAARADCGPLQ